MLHTSGVFAYSCAMSNKRRAVNAERSGGVQSVDRAVSVLEILAQRGEAGVSEVAAEIGVHKSTAFRLLGALEDARTGGADPRARQVPPRLRHPAAGQRGAGPAGPHPAGPPGLRTARRASSARPSTSRCCARTSSSTSTRRAGPSAVGAHNWVGQLTPLHATSSGKVLLAFMAPGTPPRAVGRRGAEPAHRAHHHRRQRSSRSSSRPPRGTDTPASIEELEDGLNAIAAPVRDHTGEVIAALSVSGPGLPLHRGAAARGRSRT